MKAIKIAKREILSNLKRKQFLISIFLVPLFIIGMSIFASYLAIPKEIKIGYYSNLEFPNTYKYGNTTVIKFIKVDNLEEGKKLLLENKINYLVYIPNNLLDSYKIYIYSTSKTISPIVSDTVKNIVLKDILSNKIDEKYFKLITDLEFELYTVSKQKTIKESFLSFLLPMGFMFLMYFSLITISGLIISTIIDDKRERVLELLLSFVSSRDIMIGKILGVAGLGFIQILIWGLFGAIFIIPMLSLVKISVYYLIIFLIYFFLGYLFYTSFLSGLASLFSNPKDANQIISPIIFIQVIPIIFMQYIILNPNSLITKILSYIPFTAPQVMVCRVGLTNVSYFEIILSIVVMIISIILSFKLSIKLFDIGILLYEENLSIKKIIKIIVKR
ncbi:ABC transporter permease [Methanocaldococcus indicus]|uniref:ABC transporter permease n=1 Tax=Methanocaldococcus indicus TaxID=213231 RepID=UPI003C6D3E95